MQGRYMLVLGGALFKKKKEPSPGPEDSRTREAAIRKRLVDDLRGREDAIRNKEAELVAKEQDLKKKEAELALKLQEAAVRDSELAARSGAAPSEGRPLTVKKVPKNYLPTEADNPEEQAKIIKSLEDKLVRARARHEELIRREGARKLLQETIDVYRASGYIVARLEALKGDSAGDLQSALEKYAKDVAALPGLAARCDAIDREFAPEAEALRARCNDPDAVAEIDRGIGALEGRVEAKRRTLVQKVEKWKSEGYVVTRFDRLPDRSLTVLEENTTRFEEDLEVLRMFAEKLDGMDASMKGEAEAIRARLNNPDRIPELEAEILVLEQKVGMKKQELLELLERWKAEGYRTESVEAAITADLPALRSAFLKFDENVHRLKSLGERAARLDRIFTPQLAAIDASLHDPAQIPKIEASIQSLEEETERRRTGFRTQIQDLRGRGYMVDRLERAARGTIEETTKAFDDFEKDIQKLNALAPRIQTVEKDGRFSSQVAELKKLLYQPGSHPRLERSLLELETRIRKETAGGERALSPGPAPTAPTTPPPSAPDAATALEPARLPPAGDDLEEEVKGRIHASEILIKELDAAHIDPTAASNFLKLAKSFNRSKNFSKALQYAVKAYETAAGLKR